jgi:hypothetical protein
MFKVYTEEAKEYVPKDIERKASKQPPSIHLL